MITLGDLRSWLSSRIGISVVLKFTGAVWNCTILDTDGTTILASEDSSIDIDNAIDAAAIASGL
jgi:hypothetical protein